MTNSYKSLYISNIGGEKIGGVEKDDGTPTDPFIKGYDPINENNRTLFLKIFKIILLPFRIWDKIVLFFKNSKNGF